jgi:hypothetical protein
MVNMSKLRRTASSDTRATKQAAAKAKTVAPESGDTERVSKGRRVTARKPSAIAGVRKTSAARTRIQKAAAEASTPQAADGQLQASDADVLRIAEAIAEQRKELMDRLAQ